MSGILRGAKTSLMRERNVGEAIGNVMLARGEEGGV